jgi:predicted Zn finger-like uncharacterized protein
MEIGSMHIVCPHCTTSYAIDVATLGAGGRSVRCSRCKEVWLARPQDAAAITAPKPAMAAANEQSDSAAAEWEALAGEDEMQQTPVVDSPSISGDWPEDGTSDWPADAQNDGPDRGFEAAHPRSWLRKLFTAPETHRAPAKPYLNVVACAAMGALALALVIWRVDIVRLLPQTAEFYNIIGLHVNLRGLSFRDVKITSETVEGKPLLLIEGAIVSQSRGALELPRLRFSVRDAQGAEIYAWNAVLEQPALKPGERAWFKTRLASPPPEGRNIDIRFFSKRDLTGGSA